MIADDKDHPLETAVKLLTLPVWGPIYLAGVGIMKLSTALRRRKPKQEQQVEGLRPWMPSTDVEFYAALVLSGQPVKNRRLAELMDCSPGEASRRVAQLEGVIRKKGREVLISLH
ncbi:MAG TPA: hypothetical protein VIG52_12220 [Methyloceanibacter sp.]|jgi:hypothetical protein